MSERQRVPERLLIGDIPAPVDPSRLVELSERLAGARDSGDEDRMLRGFLRNIIPIGEGFTDRLASAAVVLRQALDEGAVLGCAQTLLEGEPQAQPDEAAVVSYAVYSNVGAAHAALIPNHQGFNI